MLLSLIFRQCSAIIFLKPVGYELLLKHAISHLQVHETNSNVRLSSQILSKMVNRSIQHRVVVGGIFVMLFLIVIITIYYKI